MEKRLKSMLTAIIAIFMVMTNISGLKAQEQIEEVDNEIVLEEALEEDDVVEEIKEDESNESLEDGDTIEESLNETESEIKEVPLKDSKKEEASLNNEPLQNNTLIVNNALELDAALENIEDNGTIIFGDSFIQSNLVINNTVKHITIDANHTLWETGSIKLSGNQTGTLTLKNIKINASSLNALAIDINHSQGSVILDNIEVYNGLEGATRVNSGSLATTIFKNVYLHDNTAVNRAPAIQLGENSDLELIQSTIENNIGKGAGYETGAIASKFYNASLTINNSVFRNNRNESVNSGVFGGGGGAMAFHYFRGSINIDSSIFDANQTNGKDKEVASTYDGGAIYIFDGQEGAQFNVNNTTFSNNLAYDDGGAIMLQATGSKGMTTNIVNSTFFNNQAYGLEGANYSGGAIQYFKNGGLSKMSNTITSSTFVNNVSGSQETKLDQRGGAIGLSGSSMPAGLTRNDSLFIGNKVYGTDGNINNDSNYKDISNNTTTQEGTFNVINVDKGSNPKYTVEMILGKEDATLQNNQSSITAGVNYEIVQTIPIIPKSVADNTYSGTAVIPGNDQRQALRYKDQGAVEMSWIKYNANSGIFNLEDLTEYTGEAYYTRNADIEHEYYDQITEYFDITTNNTSLSLKSSESLNLVKEGYTFKGWSFTADGPVIDESVLLTAAKENLEVFAIWEKTPKMYTIIYTDGVLDEEIFSDQIYLVEANSETPAFVGLIEREGYIFTGWDYEIEEVVTADKTYTAQWEKIIEPEKPSFPEEPENPEKPTEPSKPQENGEPSTPGTGISSNTGILVIILCTGVLTFLIASRRKRQG